MKEENDVMESNNVISVIDSECGSGKSDFAIRKIKGSYGKNKRYIFVTPYINEINRVMKEVNNSQIVSISTPEGNEYGKTKYKNFIFRTNQTK